MRVAVCVSGVPRDTGSHYEWPEKNLNQIRRCFPYDLYTSTWESANDNYPVDFVHSDVEITYHPYIEVRWNGRKMFNDLPFKVYSWTKGHTQQFAAHAKLIESIPNDYDIIIRCRYDVIIDGTIDWQELIKMSYEQDVVMGFNVTPSMIPQGGGVKEITKDRVPVGREIGNVMNDMPWCWLADQIMIYPARLFDPKRVWKHFDEFTLRPGEWGWFQLLVEDNNHPTFKSYAGGGKYSNPKKR